jgi:chemotaxis protein methyltransferase CheR
MMSPAGMDLVLNGIVELLRDRTGLAVPPSRRGDVEVAFCKIMMKAGLADPVQCSRELHADQALLDELISEVMIGETHFFRTLDHFVFIRDVVIPEVRKLRGAGHGLRIWSAGCATGEEPYSLAILLEEEGLAESPPILATDISRTALATAREASYGTWSLRGDGMRLVDRYLRRANGRYELAMRFRSRVNFTYLNLANDTYSPATHTGAMDLVLCRNVLIYLEAETVSAVARRLYDSLADGGFLIIGPSDPPLAEYAPYETITTPGGSVYRKTAHMNPRVPDPQAPRQRHSSSDADLLSLAHIPCERLPNMVLSSVEADIPEPPDPISEAREALARGENVRVIELTSPLTTDVAAASLCARALANIGDVEAAAQTAASAAAKHPTSLEIGFLLAVLLMKLDRHSEADRCLRRILYLDRSLVVAQFTLGATLHRRGDFKGAVRAYRNARDLAARCSPEAIMPLSDGETAGRLAKAATAQVAMLQTLAEATQ